MEELKNKTLTYEVKKHLATLYKGGLPEYTKEVNIVSWNHLVPKIDIRRWENNYPRKGVTLDGTEAETLFQALRVIFDNKEDRPRNNPDLNGCMVEDGDRIAYRIDENLAILSTSNQGYTKEVNLMSWNHGNTKIDIRSWSPERRCTKGITLDIQEAKMLYDVMVDFYGGPAINPEDIPDFETSD